MLSSHGFEDAYITDIKINSEVFLTFVQHSLLQIIQPLDGDNPRSIVVFDNAAIHHCQEALNSISAAGSLVFFSSLPPYSPDLMPIEEAFSKVKAHIRDNEMAYQSTYTPRMKALKCNPLALLRTRKPPILVLAQVVI